MNLAISAARLDELDKLQFNASNMMSNASSIGSLGNINSIFSVGVNNSSQAKALAMSQNGSIFDIAKAADTDSLAAQNSNNKKSGSDASSMVVTFNNLFNTAQNSFNNVINMVKDAIQASTAEASALSGPQTSGQTINPEDNIPTDNKGSEKKAATPEDSQKPQVGFGEETVEDKPKTDTTDFGAETPVEEPTEEKVPETIQEVDQQTIKQQEEKKLEEAKKKAEEEAKLREMGQA